MNLQEAMRVLGLQNAPASFLEFGNGGVMPLPLCDVARMDALEQSYGMLGQYYTMLRAVAQTLAKDEATCFWCGLVAAYIARASIKDVLAVPLPTPQDARAAAYLRLLILHAAMPAGIQAYRARGFSEEELCQTLRDVLGSRVAVSEELTRHPGLDGSGYSWLMHYAKALIFRAGIFNITPRALYEPSLLLRHRQSGEYAVLVLSGTFHRSGIPLGSVGCIDKEGSFDADFSETPEAYVGRRIEKSRVLPVTEVYPKQQWQEIVRQGGGVVGIHIPRGVALTEENIKQSYRIAFAVCRERYPEFDVRAVHCSTWMLDPQLEEMLGTDSRITGFQKTFLRYPMGGDGAAAYSFIFKCPKPENPSQLPEKTSLQKKLKARYLRGECIYIVGGYVPDDALTCF